MMYYHMFLAIATIPNSCLHSTRLETSLILLLFAVHKNSVILFMLYMQNMVTRSSYMLRLTRMDHRGICRWIGHSTRFLLLSGEA